MVLLGNSIKVYIKPSSKRRRFAMCFPAKKKAQAGGPVHAYFRPSSCGLFLAQFVLYMQYTVPNTRYTLEYKNTLKYKNTKYIPRYIIGQL